MPHWIAVVAIVVAAWMAVAVAGGWLIGRGLGVIERYGDRESGRGKRGRSKNDDADDLRRAA